MPACCCVGWVESKPQNWGVELGDGERSDGAAHQIPAAEAAAIAAVDLGETFVSSVAALLACRGKVLATGMGKAGLVAKRFAATLCSMGTPAIHLHPGEAAHGDLGIVPEHDWIVAFSTSGKTREVLDLVALTRRLRCRPVIGITSHASSDLRRVSTHVIDKLRAGVQHATRRRPEDRHPTRARRDQHRATLTRGSPLEERLHPCMIIRDIFVSTSARWNAGGVVRSIASSAPFTPTRRAFGSVEAVPILGQGQGRARQLTEYVARRRRC